MNHIDELVNFTKENNTHESSETKEVIRSQSSYPTITTKQD
ncbi:hypothetical protein [Virgibacillus salexigens]|uniref:Uncharacterized protein n=1 Tax=Virgibacillus kapii TaxID=1638645 RepID=A0ABQ2DXU7_9BACI|nr:hypothetical protein [Virgibacillus kapii]GGJ77775.1 hypothetical protein GCM10007111_44160 [Virgibacillus kapii]